MASLTNSIHYGSVSSTSSVRDAIASCKYSLTPLCILILPTHATDRRAQYYPSSNVQSSELSQSDSDSDDLECGRSDHDESMERLPHLDEGFTRATSDHDDVLRSERWSIPTATPGRSYDTAHERVDAPETSPLLKKPSFVASSVPRLDAAGYGSIQPGSVEQEAMPIGPPSGAPELVAHDHHVGRSTYGQTVCVVAHGILACF